MPTPNPIPKPSAAVRLGLGQLGQPTPEVLVLGEAVVVESELVGGVRDGRMGVEKFPDMIAVCQF